MTETLRALGSKSLALLVLALALASLVFCVAMPLLERYQTLQSDIETKRILLGRLMAQPDVHEAEGATASPSNTAYLQGETDAVRLANLQSILNDTAKEQGIRLISSRSVDAADRQGLRLLGVTAQFNAPIEALQKLVFDLESNHGALAIESLHIMRPPGEGRIAELDVSMTLRGTAPAVGE